MIYVFFYISDRFLPISEFLFVFFMLRIPERTVAPKFLKIGMEMYFYISCALSGSSFQNFDFFIL